MPVVSPQTVLLPPTTSPATLSQRRFRRELTAVVQTALSSRTAPGTVRTYEAELRSLAPRVVDILGASVPPTSDKAAFIAFPSWVPSFLLCP